MLTKFGYRRGTTLALTAALAILLYRSYVIGWDDLGTRPNLALFLFATTSANCLGILGFILPDFRWERVAVVWSGIVLLLTMVCASSMRYIVNSESSGGLTRFCGRFSNPNSMGILAAIGFVVAIGLTGVVRGSNQGTRNRSWILGVLTVMILACAAILYLTHSRGGFLTAGVGAGLLLRETVSSQAVAKLFLVVALLIVLGLGLHWAGATIPPLVRLEAVVSGADLSVFHRLVALESGTRAIVNGPLLGVGYDCAVQVNDDWYRPLRVTTGAAISTNDYLVAGVWLGPVGLAGLLGVIATSTVRSYGAEIKTGRFSVSIHDVLRACIVAMAVAAIFNTVLFEPILASLLWISLGLSWAVANSMKNRSALSLCDKKP